MISPCKKCTEYNMPECAESCKILQDFQEKLLNKHENYAQDVFLTELPVHKDSIRSASYK